MQKDNLLLSPHFSFAEITATEKHPDLQDKNRLEASAFVDKLKEVCEVLLEPVRTHFGPVQILSGYRCEALNKTVGGVPDSQHAKAEAADFHVPGKSLDDVFNWIRTSEIPFGQVIREPGWIHISLGLPYRLADKCREALRFDGKTYRRVV
ncbi:MAG: D-Ala-D-Ala carboxypeptidase family metallohydrolase [Elusimicrobiaceae bacterium]|jgi:hypothetical protein